ncbi:hypothetical protein B0H13DRAFT_2063528, partial [Mycena leptocephala]
PLLLIRLGPAAPKSTSPAVPSDPATQQGVTKKGKPVATAREKEATTSTPQITRTRNHSHPLAMSSPHRPAPQLTVRDLSADLSTSSLFSEAPSTSNGKSKKRSRKARKATPRDTAGGDEFERLRAKILDEGEAYTKMIALMKGLWQQPLDSFGFEARPCGKDDWRGDMTH